jgi:hypothetical protein
LVLGVQHSDDCVREADRHERHEPRAVDNAHLFCGYKLALVNLLSRARRMLAMLLRLKELRRGEVVP